MGVQVTAVVYIATLAPLLVAPRGRGRHARDGIGRQFGSFAVLGFPVHERHTAQPHASGLGGCESQIDHAHGSEVGDEMVAGLGIVDIGGDSGGDIIASLETHALLVEPVHQPL
jgi:hypothetical protein